MEFVGFMQAGIPRWRLFADPGLGFAKTESQCAQILAYHKQLSHLQYY